MTKLLSNQGYSYFSINKHTNAPNPARAARHNPSEEEGHPEPIKKQRTREERERRVEGLGA